MSQPHSDTVCAAKSVLDASRCANAYCSAIANDGLSFTRLIRETDVVDVTKHFNTLEPWRMHDENTASAGTTRLRCQVAQAGPQPPARGRRVRAAAFV